MQVIGCTKSILVCLVEQNQLAAEYLLHLLAKDSRIRVVSLRTPAPIFLLDNCGLPLPVRDCLHKLRFEYPSGLFIVLDENSTARDILRLLSLGIHGFLAHREASKDLLNAVHTVAKGRMHIVPEVLREYVQSIASKQGPSFGWHRITQREDQVMELAKRRLSNKEIAHILKIGESTVKYHLANAFSKRQISTRDCLVNEHERGTSDWPSFLLAKPNI